MATTTIATLNTLVTANAVQFTNELSRAEKTGGKFSKNVSAGLGTLAGALSVGAVVGFAHSIIDLGSQITDLSLQAGMGTTAFQVLANAGMDSGFSMEQIAKSSEDLRNHIQDAAAGSKPMVESLQKLNLTAEGLQALAPEEQWEVIAKRIANATNKQEAMNVASELFGTKNAPKMREMLSKLATDGYDKLAASTKDLTFTPEQLKSLDDAGDKIAYIMKLFKVQSAKGFLGASDAFEGMSKDMQAQADKNETDALIKGDKKLSWWDQRIENFKAKFGAGEQSVSALEDPMHGHAFLPEPENPKNTAAEEAAKAAATKSDIDAKMAAAEATAIQKRFDEQMKSLMEQQPIVEQKKAAVEQYHAPQADNLARIGLLTGTQVNPEVKRQTHFLQGIHEVLQAINRGIRQSDPATFSN